MIGLLKESITLLSNIGSKSAVEGSIFSMVIILIIQISEKKNTFVIFSNNYFTKEVNSV